MHGWVLLSQYTSCFLIIVFIIMFTLKCLLTVMHDFDIEDQIFSWLLWQSLTPFFFIGIHCSLCLWVFWWYILYIIPYLSDSHLIPVNLGCVWPQIELFDYDCNCILRLSKPFTALSMDIVIFDTTQICDCIHSLYDDHVLNTMGSPSIMILVYNFDVLFLNLPLCVNM